MIIQRLKSYAQLNSPRHPVEGSRHRSISETAIFQLPVVLGRTVNVEFGESLFDPILGWFAVLLFVIRNRERDLGVWGNTESMSLRWLSISEVDLNFAYSLT